MIAFKQYGHLAHCSFGPWQLLYVNDRARMNPELYGELDFAALRTITFFNEEIFGRQGAKTIVQAADAWNSGNFRDQIIPADYIAAVLHNYYNVPMPPAITIHASAGKDANSLYADLTGAIERLGPGWHGGALVDVPVLVRVNGVTLTVEGSEITVTNDEKSARVESITLVAN